MLHVYATKRAKGHGGYAYVFDWSRNYTTRMGVYSMTEEVNTTPAETPDAATTTPETGVKAAEGRIVGWFDERLKEPSTWVGLIGFVATAFGTTVDPASATMIATTAASVMGGFLVMLKQQKKGK